VDARSEQPSWKAAQPDAAEIGDSAGAADHCQLAKVAFSEQSMTPKLIVSPTVELK
jgi:hypothetical protein